MKKKFAKGLMIFGILLLLALSGCQSQSSQALKNELAYRKLGINKLEEGDYQAAEEAFQKALDESMAMIRPLEIDICYYKALAQSQAGNVKGALETYTALIEYDKKNPDAYYLRGCLYLGQEQTENAAKDFKQAVQLDAKRYELYIGIYEQYLAAKLEEQGNTYLDEALKLEAKSEADYLGRGRVYYAKKDYENAKSSLDQADPKDPQTILCLAGIYRAEGEEKKAKELYTSYLKEFPEDTAVFYELSAAEMEDGNYEEALFYIQAALENENKELDQELRRSEIAAYEYLGDFAKAEEKLVSYLADYPEDAEAERELTFLETRS